MDELARRYWKTLSKMIDENKTTKELENDRKIKRLRAESNG
jgi:hypothetical protein